MKPRIGEVYAEIYSDRRVRVFAVLRNRRVRVQNVETGRVSDMTWAHLEKAFGVAS
jgi:hypothetical protein